MEKKNVASLIIAGAKPESEPMESEGDSEGEVTAAEEVIGAIKSGNTAKFIESMKAFIDICRYSSEE